MRITIDLEPADLESLSQALQRSRRIANESLENDIVDAAMQALASLPIRSAPSYVRKQLASVHGLLVMLEDEAWALPALQREEVLAALVYFSDPEDLIPDEIPVIGLLDDAIVLEILLRGLQPVVRAYADFCRYRERLGVLPQQTPQRMLYAKRLARRRDALRVRMQARVKPTLRAAKTATAL